MTQPRPWWADAVVYQVYPRSFLDTDGDGEGDLRGVTRGIAALADLGVDAVWLSPFYPSPLADSGYDIADHRAVDPRYGTIEDFDALVAEAHAHDLRVLVDLVPNHVSVEHVWFRQALAEGPGSPARTLFHFRDGRGEGGDQPPTNWQSVFTGPAWTRVSEPDGRPGQWYLHLFDSSQPDLNWANPAVRADLLETLRFWLGHGVDGFRVDVAIGMAKDMGAGDHPDPAGLVDAIRLDLFDGSPEAYSRRELMADSPIFDVDELHEYLREWRTELDRHDPDLLTVGEAWTHPPDRARRYTRPDELRQVFNFDFLVVPWEAGAIAGLVRRTLEEDRLGSPATWALDNHDTPRMATRLGGGDRGVRRARALALLTLALPGTVYLYQGQELGLQDADMPDASRQDPVFLRSGGRQRGRDGGRVPLPWSGDRPPYGFSPDGAHAPWLPQPEGWQPLTRAAQAGDPASALEMYRAALAERRARRDGWRSRGPEVSIAGGVVAVRHADGLTCLLNVSDRTVDPQVRGTVVVASTDEAVPGEALLQVPPECAVWLDSDR